VLKVGGGLRCAGDACLFVAKQIWWARPIAMLFGLPGFNWVGVVGIAGSTGIAIVFRGIALPEKRLTAAKEKL
jgi:hypothetical protein